MELSEIVYSILAIVLFLVTLIFIISYLGYKMKQKEIPNQNNPLLRYQELRTGTSGSFERK